MSAARQPAPHRFTVDEYFRMADAGILDRDARVELIDGEILDMPPPGGPHVFLVNRLNRLLVQRLGESAVVSIRNSLLLSEFSAPQPDAAVLEPRVDRIDAGVPRTEHVLLAIEVADTSLSWDRGRKLELYARAGIREYWVVDVNGGTVEVCRDAGPDGYGQRVRLGRGERVSPAFAPEVSFPVEELFD